MKKKSVQEAETLRLSLCEEKAYPISDKLYGIFLEDIGFAADGGLNANAVNNYSFDGEYMDPDTMKKVSDPLRYWHLSNGKMTSRRKGGPGVSRYAKLDVNPQSCLVNEGYHGGHYGDRPAVSIIKGETYVFSCFVRSEGFEGNVSVQIRDGTGSALTETGTIPVTEKEWQRLCVTVSGISSGYGRLCIAFDSEGILDMDVVEFYCADHWGASDPKWRHGRFRRDLIETLQALHPAFLRFPGGCIVEGMDPDNSYHWKDTVGELWERKPKFCLWAEKQPDGGYCQSYQIGFYEYFCLCEDLHMRPLPTLNAGLACQIRKEVHSFDFQDIPLESREFEEQIVQDYLDLIDFAKGDPETNRWAALRASMGHPEPFFLDRIGIGNENYGKEYLAKFTKIAEAVRKKDPSITLIMCGGHKPQRKELDPYWRFIRRRYPNDLLDEHSYHSPEWFERQAHRFDNYPRGTSKVYMGEYSANDLHSRKEMTIENTNTMASALGEAAFMTGMERNGDVVEMSSYAPLFNLIDSENWYANLIDFNPACVCPSANYYTQQLFGKYYGHTAVPLEGELPQKVHAGVYVSATESEDTLYMKAVNTSPVPYRLVIDHIPVKNGTASGEILQCDDLKAKNRLAFEGEPVMAIQPREVSCTVENGKLEMILPPQSIQGAALKIQ